MYAAVDSHLGCLVLMGQLTGTAEDKSPARSQHEGPDQILHIPLVLQKARERLPLSHSVRLHLATWHPAGLEPRVGLAPRIGDRRRGRRASERRCTRRV